MKMALEGSKRSQAPGLAFFLVINVAMIASSTTTTTTPPCPEGWGLSGGVCKRLFTHCQVKNTPMLSSWVTLETKTCGTTPGKGQGCVHGKLSKDEAKKACHARGLIRMAYLPIYALPTLEVRPCVDQLFTRMVNSGNYGGHGTVDVWTSTDSSYTYNHASTPNVIVDSPTKYSLCTGFWTFHDDNRNGWSAAKLGSGINGHLQPHFARDNCHSIGYQFISVKDLEAWKHHFTGLSTFMNVLSYLIAEGKEAKINSHDGSLSIQNMTASQSGFNLLCLKLCRNNGTLSKDRNCVCPPKWTGQFCTEAVDECKVGIHNCSDKETCHKTFSSFKCCPIGNALYEGKCKASYPFDGKASGHCSYGSVHIPAGYFLQPVNASEADKICSKAGLTLLNADGPSPWCAMSYLKWLVARYPWVNIGAFTSMSYGGMTKYYKVDLNGFSAPWIPLQSSSVQLIAICNGVDECKAGTHTCSVTEACHKTFSSFRCCPLGHDLKAGVCREINECTNPMTCDYPYVCENTIGSYNCIKLCTNPNVLNANTHLINDHLNDWKLWLSVMRFRGFWNIQLDKSFGNKVVISCYAGYGIKARNIPSTTTTITLDCIGQQWSQSVTCVPLSTAVPTITSGAVTLRGVSHQDYTLQYFYARAGAKPNVLGEVPRASFNCTCPSSVLNLGPRYACVCKNFEEGAYRYFPTIQNAFERMVLSAHGHGNRTIKVYTDVKRDAIIQHGKVIKYQAAGQDPVLPICLKICRHLKSWE